MKRLAGAFILLLGAFTTILGVPQASASSTVTLTEPTHRQINGQFIDDELTQSLQVDGRLGQLVFNPPAGAKRWVIDPALIEDVTAMSNGYSLTSGAPGTGIQVAKDWLNQLHADLVGVKVVALAYSNPSLYWMNQLSPHVVDYVLAISKDRLESDLGIPVTAPTGYSSHSEFAISSADIDSIKSDTTSFANTAPYIDPQMIDNYRLGLVRILNPNLTGDRRSYLIRDYTAQAYAEMHLVHLSPGKFTVTSRHQNLPITLTNNFPTDMKITLRVISTNPKILITDVPTQTIPAKSKIQVMVPIEVLTSGASGFNVQVIASNGTVLGDELYYPLNLTVISPIATWFTTGAAILLFIAATIQSIRRIRRSRIGKSDE